jgi:xanthine dehydrogenase YagR molybdenum-binding subunit
MSNADLHVGSPRSRVDGPLKVTGQARYAAEFAAPGLLHGVIVSSAITRGRILRIDASQALAVAGVVQVFTHENRPATAWFDYKHRDETAPPGSPFRPLYDDAIAFAGQAIALVVADDYEAARYAATLVRVDYAPEEHFTNLELQREEAYTPPKKRNGVKPPPKPRGDADAALAAAPVKLQNEYSVAIEHHNPMEPHATTVVWEGDGKLTIHDKTQGSQNSQSYVASVFGLSSADVRVVAPFVGGAFGSGLRPQHQLFLAVMAALELKRSVRVELTRDQTFTLGYRPYTIQQLAIAADRDGKLQAVKHDAVAGTSQFEDYQEVVVNWSGFLYDVPNAELTYRLAKLDTYTPCDMRAPGATLGVYALETAMDEIACELGLDPVELRLRNFNAKDKDEDKVFTSKELRACYAQGAERFGWSNRNPTPRSMREGRELVGWGMASGVWEAMMQKTAARVAVKRDGGVEVACATADIGTGTYTILAQLAADAFGLPLDKVDVKLGDSSLPKSPVEGGSWTAASAGSAVQAACESARKSLLKAARGLDGSPLGNADLDHVAFRDGRVVLASDAARSLSFSEILAGAGLDAIEEEESAAPSRITQMLYAGYTHSAIFAEVKIDEELGVVRVTRIVNAVAAGRILNPKTARSQILGGVVMGLGMALQEETLLDHTLGRFMNHNLGEYHVPVNADIHDIDVIFVEEHDDKVSPIGVKGLGEIGIVGTAAAIANAVFHATGKRIRDLPITIDKIIAP